MRELEGFSMDQDTPASWHQTTAFAQNLYKMFAAATRLRSSPCKLGRPSGYSSVLSCFGSGPTFLRICLARDAVPQGGAKCIYTSPGSLVILANSLWPLGTRLIRGACSSRRLWARAALNKENVLPRFCSVYTTKQTVCELCFCHVLDFALFMYFEIVLGTTKFF